MEFAPLVIDVILIIVILASAIAACKEGFVTAIINLVGNLAGLILAWFISNRCAILVFDKFFKSKLVAKTFEYIQTTGNVADLQVMIDELVGGLPLSFLEGFVTQTPPPAESLTDASISTANLIVETFLGPIITLLIGIIMFVAIIIICKIITSLLASGLKIVNHIPVLGFANRIAGFLVGIAIGGINVILLSCFLSIIAIITQNSLSFLNIDVLAQSSILALTGKFNPFIG